MLEAVERKLHVEIASGLPSLRMLLVVGSVGRRRLLRLGEARIEHLIACARRRPLEDGRNIREVLQVALADQRRCVAGRAQRVDERVRLQRQRHAVAAHAVHRRHPPGHQGRAVGHADRRRHVEALEPGAARGDRVDMRGLEDGMAVAAEIIETMLVSDEKKKVRPCCHHCSRSLLVFSADADRPRHSHVQSTCILASLTMRAHNSVSACRRALASAPEGPTASRSCARNLSCTSACFSASCTSRSSRPAIASGTPAGASSTKYESILKSGYPASAMVGTSGASGARLPAEMARPLSLPARTWWMTPVVATKPAFTSPATRSMTSGALPR